MIFPKQIRKRLFARKIWSIAMYWESLILRTPNYKQLMLCLSTNRFTRKREMVKYLECFGHSSPYHTILSLNSKGSESLPPSHFCFVNVKHLHPTILTKPTMIHNQILYFEIYRWPEKIWTLNISVSKNNITGVSSKSFI